MAKKKTYVDHEGRQFDSIVKMAEYWNVPKSTLQRRLVDMKMSIKDALAFDINTHDTKRTCYDHEGRKFPSKSAMCRYHNISTQIFFGRMKNKWSLKDALTLPPDKVPHNTKTITDHKGNTFKSVSKMCEYWGVKRSTYNLKIKQGKSIKEALTTEYKNPDIKTQKCIDHKGIEYKSLNEMCNAYGISHHTFKTRLDKLGWTLEDALTKKQVINSIECIDHNGNKFPTKRDLSNYYCIPEYRLQGENYETHMIHDVIRKSWIKSKKIGDVTIEKRITYPYFLVKYNNHEMILSVDSILDIYHNTTFNPLPNSKIKDKNLTVEKCIGFPNYIVNYKNNIETWDYWKLINHRRDTNFGLCSDANGV